MYFLSHLQPLRDLESLEMTWERNACDMTTPARLSFENPRFCFTKINCYLSTNLSSGTCCPIAAVVVYFDVKDYLNGQGLSEGFLRQTIKRFSTKRGAYENQCNWMATLMDQILIPMNSLKYMLMYCALAWFLQIHSHRLQNVIDQGGRWIQLHGLPWSPRYMWNSFIEKRESSIWVQEVVLQATGAKFTHIGVLVPAVQFDNIENRWNRKACFISHS